ncbi:MAG TPA: TIGR03067 domain-containing protein [Opitutaceae bacterium]|nr:TIGR03067 domain-containing protein [Opitutaceae bacterium]
MTVDGLDGRWQPLRAELDGQAAPDEVLEQTELEFAGDRYRVRFGGRIADAGIWARISHAPGTLILHGHEGTNAGRSLPSLYQLAGNRLRLCVGLDGRPPEGFAAGAGSNCYLVTYRRKTP